MRLLPRLLLFTGFALLIIGSKLALIRFAGSDLPVLDQWDAEAEVTFRPWFEGRFGWAALVHPHNEHRLIITKLYALGLLLANGQWSGFLETTVNAILHAACALVLLTMSARWLRGVWRGAFGVLLVLLFSLPFAWENTLVGFQAQFYFLLLFSLGHLLFSLETDRFSWRWGLGQLCGVLALASMASGFLSALAVLTTLAVRTVLHRSRWTRQHFTTAVLAMTLIAIGWWMRVEVSGHEPLRAHRVIDFARSLLQLLAWPSPAFLPWVLAPATFFVWRTWRRRHAQTMDPILVGLLVWSLLQCAALAYGRGGGLVLASRYLDLLALNVALGLVFIVRELDGRTRAIIGMLWLLATGTALVICGRDQWRGAVLPLKSAHVVQEQVVRDYLRTGNPGLLADKTWPELPYPSPAVLQQRLDLPVLRSLLPASVRSSLALASSSGAPSARSVPSTIAASPSPIVVSTFPVDPAQTLEWQSAVLPPSHLPILRFRIAGDLGPDSDRLRLAVKSAAGTVAVIPDRAPGQRWKAVAIIHPAGAWWIEASDADPRGWFAFTEPVEVGYGTWLAEKLLKYSTVALACGGALLMIGGALAVFQRSGTPVPSGQTTAATPTPP